MATTPSTTTNGARAAAKPATARKPVTAKPIPATPETPVELAVAYAERVAYVQVGAVLTARDNVVETLDELRAKYGTRDAAEKELKKLEKRGASARTKAQRSLKQRRNRVERELKKNRTRVERELRTIRQDAEQQVKTLRADVAEQLPANLATNVQEIVVPVIGLATQVAKDVQGRVTALAA